MKAIQQEMSELFTIENAVVRIKIGEIPTLIDVLIFPSEDGRYAIEASHGIKTDLQAEVCWVPNRIHDTAGDALDAVYYAFWTFYNAAALRGFQPSEKWLVEKPEVSPPPRPRRKPSRPRRKQPSRAAPAKRRTKGKDRAARGR